MPATPDYSDAPWTRLTIGSRQPRPWGMGPNFYAMGPDQDDGDHLFDGFDLWLGLEGACEVRMLGHRLELRAGRAILIPPGVRARQLTGPGQELMMMYVHFDCLVDGKPVLDAAEYADAEHLQLSLAGLPPLALAAEIDAAGLAERLRRIRMRPDGDLAQLQLSLVLIDVIVHLREACLGLAGSIAERRLERAISFMEQHLDQQITLADVAGQAHVSPATLGRLFRTHYRASPIQYLTRIRMARARELLRSRRYNISEIARACGYASVQYFSRAFRKQYGLPPSTFRDRLPLIP